MSDTPDDDLKDLFGDDEVAETEVQETAPAPAPKAARAKPKAKAAKAPTDPNSQNPAKSGEARVLIQLHESPDIPPGGVFIGVNGYGYTLRPGAPVRVPVSVLRVLETAVVKRPIYANNADTGKVIGWSEAPRYAFTRIGDPD